MPRARVPARAARDIMPLIDAATRYACYVYACRYFIFYYSFMIYFGRCRYYFCALPFTRRLINHIAVDVYAPRHVYAC